MGMTVRYTEICLPRDRHDADRLALGHYKSPLGGITLTADEIGLTGLRFDDPSRSCALPGDETQADHELPAITLARDWLDAYFAGQVPNNNVPLHLIGTAFQEQVWQILLAIPYGTTRTYGDIAQELAEARGIPRMSAQAVGGAVGRNPIALIVPCHRVVGAHGRLGGYAGGTERKLALLQLEGIPYETALTSSTRSSKSGLSFSADL